MILSDLSRLFINASVDETEIGKVKLGQRAKITADAFPGRTFHGKVERIATKGINVANVVTFEVRIEVRGKNKSLLKPEMTANVEIIAAEKNNVLSVPEQAVSYRNRVASVKVRKNGRIEERLVKTGIRDGVVVEILEGLYPGETVVYRPREARSRWRSERSRRNLATGRGMRMILGGGRR